MTYLRILKVLAINLLLSITTAAQCPSGFVYVGKLSDSTKGTEVKTRPSIQLPDGLDLDTSYHQPSPSGQGGRAGSILSKQQIPAGIYIIPGGAGSYGWAVSDPTMLDSRTFQMYLYCSQDSGALNLNFGCSVYVEVCAKPKNGVSGKGPTTGSGPAPVSLPPPKKQQTQRINIQVENNSSFQNTFEIYDNVCKESKPDMTLTPHQKKPLNICSSGATNNGYGSFRARQKGNTTWNNFDLVSDGETRSLN